MAEMKLDYRGRVVAALSAALLFSVLSAFVGATDPQTNATMIDLLGNPWPCMFGMAWCTSVPASPVGIFVNLTCTSANGWCGQTYYCQSAMPGCTPNIPYNLAGPFQAGMSYVSFYTANASGNLLTEPVQTVMLLIDAASPVTTATATLANGTPYNFGYAANQSVNVTLSCYSASGCNLTQYCTDGTNTCTPGTTYSAPVNVATSRYFRYRSRNNAGTTEATKSARIEIGVHPVTTATAVKSAGGAYVFGTWTNASVSVTLACTDVGGPGCGPSSYCESIGCVPYLTYAAPFSVSRTSPVNITFSSNDTAGVAEPPSSAQILFDVSAPLTMASAVNSTGGTYVFGSNISTLTAVNVTLTCADTGGSGCNTTLYCNDANNTCAPNTTYAAPFPIPLGGQSYVRYMSVDNAGNIEAAKANVIILLSACQTGADLNGDHIVSLSELLGYIGQWKIGNVTLTLLLKAIGFWRVGVGC